MDTGCAATDDVGEDYGKENVQAISANTGCYTCEGWRTSLARVLPSHMGPRREVREHQHGEGKG